MPRQAMNHPPRRPWPLLGFVGGWLVALADYALFRVTGLEMRLGGADATLAVTLLFGLTFALLGYALGRLAVARSALQRSQEALVRQEKLAALGRLMASIAHELRNPLGVVRSAAGVLRERGAGDPRLERAAELVTEEVDHMNATISALLSFARPARLRLAEIDVASLLERGQRLAAERLTEGGAVVASRLAPGLPGVTGDVHLLAQLLAGLLDNAAAAGSARIELRAEADDGQVRIDVADDGPGIAAEETARVFEPFYTTRADGTGLGLALAHRVADAHGGRLEAVAGEGAGPGGRGACLRLRLPVVPGERP